MDGRTAGRLTVTRRMHALSFDARQVETESGFVDSENHAGNATTLEGRAEEDATGSAERRSFDVAES